MKQTSIIAMVSCILLTGCPGTDECIKPYTFKGQVVDGTSTPITGVEVRVVTHYGTDFSVTTTDSNGEYEAEQSAYSDLGNSYLYFKKSGYQNFSTQDQPIGKGDGTCRDQIIVRNAVMTP